MSLSVKICGLTTVAAVKAAVNADYIGFIFYPPSPRHVEPLLAKELSVYAADVKKVAVFVNPSDVFLDDVLKHFTPDLLQLHGSESLERLGQLRARYGLPLIKAFNIAKKSDLAVISDYQEHVDMLLLDAKTEGVLPGGMGQTFDWSLLDDFISHKPWFLSGGLYEDNVEEAVRITGAKYLDVSSRLESSPGVKDPARVQVFIKKVRSIQ